MGEEKREEGLTPPGQTHSSEYDLQFVRLDELAEGGWYRELPDHLLEVMSHARLHRVPLGNSDPAQKAREVVADIVKQRKN